MYDLQFVAHACGLGDLPEGIDLRRLFNVSYELGSGQVKLYIVDKSEQFLYKIGGGKIGRQYSGDAPESGADFGRLCRFLDCRLDPRQIVIDAVDGQTYYLYLADAGVGQSRKLLNALRVRFGIGEPELLAAIGRVAGQRFGNLTEACVDKAVPGVRVPFDDGLVKVYGRPFLRGRPVELDARCIEFLQKLFGDDGNPPQAKLKHGWLGEEIPTGRTVLVTQFHELLHD